MVEDISMTNDNFIRNYNKNSEIRCTLVKGVGYLFYLIAIRMARVWSGHFIFFQDFLEDIFLIQLSV